MKAGKLGLVIAGVMAISAPAFAGYNDPMQFDRMANVSGNRGAIKMECEGPKVVMKNTNLNNKKGADCWMAAGQGSGHAGMMMDGDSIYQPAMDKMHEDAAKAKLTGDPEGDFVRLMIPHHQGAIDMAKVLHAHSKPKTTLHKLSHKIMKEQAAEIKLMQKWLKKNPKK